ncbi:hypothetical protein SAMN04487894_105205 [Niabella drilacis]|uniref:Uncharacterized protein n=1 Tax=Niabella drilacis (strain DSM 25811 / CCM 8410 / CCUG 62505 / LMG 26954 / E90) TaxID=1285928 RepID=A0A1G6RAA8_NIADE|nr:hypothetical protein SAMN04487894_105205 [Niabella drilacis]
MQIALSCGIYRSCNGMLPALKKQACAAPGPVSRVNPEFIQRPGTTRQHICISARKIHKTRPCYGSFHCGHTHSNPEKPDYIQPKK